jgi:hypothetical protein
MLGSRTSLQLQPPTSIAFIDDGLLLQSSFYILQETMPGHYNRRLCNLVLTECVMKLWEVSLG